MEQKRLKKLLDGDLSYFYGRREEEGKIVYKKVVTELEDGTSSVSYQEI